MENYKQSAKFVDIPSFKDMNYTAYRLSLHENQLCIKLHLSHAVFQSSEISCLTTDKLGQPGLGHTGHVLSVNITAQNNGVIVSSL